MRKGDQLSKYAVDDSIDVVFKISMEEFQGRINLTMIIEDLKPSE